MQRPREWSKSCGLHLGQCGVDEAQPSCRALTKIHWLRGGMRDDEVDGVVSGSGGAGEGGFIKALIDLILLDQKNSGTTAPGLSQTRKKNKGCRKATRGGEDKVRRMVVSRRVGGWCLCAYERGTKLRELLAEKKTAAGGRGVVLSDKGQ